MQSRNSEPSARLERKHITHFRCSTGKGNAHTHNFNRLEAMTSGAHGLLPLPLTFLPPPMSTRARPSLFTVMVAALSRNHRGPTKCTFVAGRRRSNVPSSPLTTPLRQRRPIQSELGKRALSGQGSLPPLPTRLRSLHLAGACRSASTPTGGRLQTQASLEQPRSMLFLSATALVAIL